MIPINGLIRIVQLGLDIYKTKMDEKDPETYRRNMAAILRELDKDPLKRDMALVDEAQRENIMIEEKLEHILRRELAH